jgi:hypothetical protein
MTKASEKLPIFAGMKNCFTIFLALFFAFSAAVAQPGNALQFDGANDHVAATVPALFSNLNANDFTFEAWVYPQGAIFSRIIYAQAATNNFATMSTGATNNIYFYVVRNGTNHSIATTATLPQNQWTHVATRWTASTQSLAVYFNGVLQTGAAGGTSSTGTSGIMSLGTRPGGTTQFFPGAMDEVRVWSTARTQCDIVANMNRSFTGPQTNLVAYYDFNQGVPGGNNAGLTTLNDGSGGGFNGTLTNFALTGTTSNWITSTANITSTGNAVGGYTIPVSAAVCSGDSYTFPDGSTQTNITSQVVQSSTFTAVNGCDSVIVTTVDVNPVYSLSDSALVCSGDSFAFADGTVQTNITAQVVHTSNLQASTGCDSVIVTTVDVLPSFNQSESALVCPGSSYVYPDGSMDTNITSTVVHSSVLSTVQGCDSVIVTTVNVAPAYSFADSATVCSGGDFTFHDGTTQTDITSQVVHTSSLQTVLGCDSVIVTTVHVTVVDTSVTQVGNTLTANASNATFQWIDCLNVFPIVGETNASFTPAASGNYSVAVTQGGCTDTSSCHQVIILGVGAGAGMDVRVYPNPNAGEFMVELKEVAAGGAMVEVVNGLGQVVYQKQLDQAGQHAVQLGDIAAGVYMLHVKMEGKVAVRRVVVEK